MKLSKQHVQTFFDSLKILLFALAISVPFAKTILSSPRDISKVEQRPLVHDLELKGQPFEQFVRQFETYFSDQLGFRDQLVVWNNYLTVRGLNQSPVPKVVVGKDGWLYLYEGIEDYRGLMQFSEEELELWRLTLEAKRDWLGAQGIEYLFIITPDKHTIYPEYVPDYYTRVSKVTLLDQLLAYMQEHSDIEILDLREVAREAKQQQQVYYSLDTHWNDAGGFAAYRAIIERMAVDFPAEKAMTASDLTIGQRPDPADLVTMLGLAENYPRKDTVMLSVSAPCAASTVEKSLKYARDAFWMRCPDAQLNAIVFRDSFFTHVIGYLAQHFNQSIFVWQNYNQVVIQDLIDQVQPDIVIEEIVERRLPVIEFGGYFPETLERIAATNTFEQLPYSYVTKDAASDYADVVFDADTTITPRVEPQSAPSDLDPETVAPGLLVQSAGIRPQMVFSIPPVPPGATVGVRMVLTTAKANTLLVYFRGEDGPFRDDKMVRATLVPGKNEVYLTFDSSENVSQIRIDPGLTPGNYLIHAVEIRGSVPPGS